MFKRLLLVTLCWSLTCEWVSGQESDARPAERFQLNGVLISDSSRSALVNGEQLQVGDQIGGMEIVAIEPEGVRVLMGARELVADVGGTFVANPLFDDASRKWRLPTRQNRNQARRARLRHEVRPGETLSSIAEHYLGGGITRNQVVVALFRENPQAFGGNINALRAGAVLRIPDENELRSQAPEAATAEVVAQTDAWRSGIRQPSRLANAPRDRQYGPVKSGETLSGIAASVLPDGVTINQMIVALFRSNPLAFSDNINVLHEGAILHIPNETEARRQVPATATAEVVRQTKAWQTGYEEPAALTVAQSNVMASSDELIN